MQHQHLLPIPLDLAINPRKALVTSIRVDVGTHDMSVSLSSAVKIEEGPLP
jgi:hypothetical protein